MDTVRDIVIIVWGIVSILTLIVVLLIALFIGMSVRNLVGTVNELVNSSVKPVIETTQQSLTNVSGTTRFVGETVVSPIIRVISVGSGIKRAVGVFTGVTGKVRGKGER